MLGFLKLLNESESRRDEIALVLILLVASLLRFWDLERTSLWIDEVVPMRMARTENPIAMVALMDQIDGARAPLHPLLLQAWLRVLGTSDWAGRSFSVVCGLVTVWAVWLLGRRAFDESTGRWSAWLAAVCPPLVYYSREIRMYAPLILLTCLSWLVFLSFRRSATKAQSITYGLLLTAQIYSHSVALFMLAAHGLAYLLVRSSLKLPLRWWLAIQLGVILAVLPWIRRYLDHGTDYPIPRYSIRFLLAIPIEYIGGNSIVLAVCLLIVAYGLVSWRFEVLTLRLSWRSGHEPAKSSRTENLVFLTWAVAPPVLMYVYSYFAQPVFGPARYHLFIAPAYLILLAHGLSKLPALIRWPAAAVGLSLSMGLIQADAFFPGIKADWRGLRERLTRLAEEDRSLGLQPAPITIVVHPSDPRFTHEEIRAARYYLSPQFELVLAGEAIEPSNGPQPRTIYEAYCLKQQNWHAKLAPEDVMVLNGLVVKNRQ
jgi:4-amino-4-deoxy-L-arabinose transferase-like glycosyltransferase